MNKVKLYEDKDIVVYTKRELEVGQEADVADSVLICAFQGYKTFAGHLKEKEKFYNEVKANILKKFDELV